MNTLFSVKGPFIKDFIVSTENGIHDIRYYIFYYESGFQSRERFGGTQYLNLKTKQFQDSCGLANMFRSYGSARNFMIKHCGVDPGPKHIGLTEEQRMIDLYS